MMTEAPSTDNSPEPPPRSTGVTFSRPMIVALLYLLNIALGFTVLVGVVLAYVWRSDADSQEWELTHFTYLITTFWIGFVLFMGSFVLFFGTFFATIPAPGDPSDLPGALFFVTFFGTFFVWLLLAAWFSIRCILSIVRATSERPMPRPRTVLF